MNRCVSAIKMLLSLTLLSSVFTTLSYAASGPPTITTQPASQSVLQGNPVTFSVVVDGTAPFLYQWRRDGVPIPDATGTSYSIASTVGGDNGAVFSVLVTNSLGNTTSGNATLRIDPGAAGSTYTTNNIIHITSQSWRYFTNGTDLGTSWVLPGFDDSSWRQGPGLLGVESTPASYPAPFGSTFVPYNNQIITYYFRTHFTFSPTGNVYGAMLNVTSYVDDGAVFYLNGGEIGRARLAPGQTATTLASDQGAEGTPDVFTVAAANLVPGDNVLAVEVHQASQGSSDIVFGMRMDATIINRIPDTTPPSLISRAPLAGAIVKSLTTIQVDFSEPVDNVNASDLIINSIPATNVLGVTPSTFQFEFPQPPTGTVNVAFAGGHGITDFGLVPNPFPGASWSYTLDPNAIIAPFVINEFLASNSGSSTNSLRDEDGDSSDWIEIYNPALTVGDIGGWFLTDETNNLAKWKFPAGTILTARGYLVVFASGKNRTNTPRFHTNFALDGAGEFLALVDPGTNIVSAFSPFYPQQFTDVSYGRDKANLDFTGYFTRLTPGAENDTSGAGFAPEVRFSRSGSTYVNSFQLTLSTDDPNAVIRYNLVNTAQNVNNATNIPTSASTLYTGPITINGTLQVRARAFSSNPNVFPGPPRTESYIQLAAAAAGITSAIPIVVIHTLATTAVSSGGGLPDTSATVAFFDNDCGYAALTNKPQLITRAGFNLRGSSTQGYAKSSWAVELWDEFNEDDHLEVLGLPAESDWVLYAPNHFDPSLMHNPIYYELSRMAGVYASRTRFVEVYFRNGAGAITANLAATLAGMGDYNGVYVLAEKVKRDNDRVDIDQLEPEQTNSPAITGGYLMSVDRTDPNERNFPAGGLTINYQDPDGLEMVTPLRTKQRDYLTSYINAFSATLAGSALTNNTGTNHYSYYFDVDAAIDHNILGCFALNADSMRLSGYFFKPRNGKLTYGPIWDCDRGLGSGVARADNDWRAYNPRCWTSSNPLGIGGGDFGTDYFNPNNVFSNPWYARLFQDPDFWQKWIDRWQELRSTAWSSNAVLGLVTNFGTHLQGAQQRNQARWGGMGGGADSSPRSGVITSPNSDYTHTFPTPGTFQGELDFQKRWLGDRLYYLDTNLLARPLIDLVEGPVASGTVVTISDVTGKAGTKIYYTLDGTDPRASQNRTNAAAVEYTGPITITSNVRIVARALNPNHRNLTGTMAPGGVNHANPPISSIWSGPAAASYYVGLPPLRITEIMFHPPPPPPGNTNDEDNFEYIEFKNISGASLNIGGYRLRGGVDFTFTNITLQAGGACVIVKDLDAFSSRYGVNNPNILIAGVYTNDNLANDGDHLVLTDNTRAPILDFSYSDDWYPATDGAGFALQIVNPNAGTNTWGLQASWRPSGSLNGSPGTDDGGAVATPLVYINEVLTRPGSGQVTAIELFNASGGTANIGGWFLTDNFDQPKKYRIQNGTSIPTGNYLVLNADTTFGGSFQLNSRGEEIHLFSGDANTNLTGYSDGFDFGAQFTNVTFGRYMSSSGVQYPAQITSTLGGANSGPRVGPFVISEVMYHPPDMVALDGPRDNQKDEYIELENITGQSQPLFDPARPANTWRLRDSVTFNFPSNLTVAAGGRVLIVSFDPVADPLEADAFRARNGAFQGAPLVGPYSGKLDNSSDSIELVRPDAPLPGGAVDYILVDKVRYFDTAPWPLEADGLGFALQRRVVGAYGNDVTNWIADVKTPGYGYGVGGGPVVTMHPQSISVLGTRQAQFSVTATGAPPIFYQWFFGNTGIPGATNSIYIIASVQPSQAGQYRCLCQNEGGAAFSQAATLTYITPANITFHPTNVNLRIPPDAQTTIRQAFFRVAATTANPPLTYQWLKNETNISAALNASAVSNLLTISNVVLADEGRYQCAVTDGAGTIYSFPATLTPWITPSFIVPPIPNQTNPVSTAFSVSLVLTAYPPPYTVFYRSNSAFVGRTDFSNHASFFTYPGSSASPLVTSTWYRIIASNIATIGSGVATHMTNHTRADFDMDGILDSIEVQYGLNTNNMADAALDLDGDKMSNLAEFIAGTDMGDANSYLKIEQNTAPGTATLFFGTAAGKTYTIQFADRLTGSPSDWKRLTDFIARTTPAVETVTDPNWTTNRFYRVATPRVP